MRSFSFLFVFMMMFMLAVAIPPRTEAANPPAHPLQKRLEGYWVSQDKDQLKWEFSPGKRNTGHLYDWFRDISYHKSPYLLMGRDQLVLPQKKLKFRIKFSKGLMILSQGKKQRTFKKIS